MPKRVTAIGVNFTAPAFGTGLNAGTDSIDGGLGDDVLFGSRADKLTDTAGANFLENSDAGRSLERIQEGADVGLKSTIRKFLQSLTGHTLGLKNTEGKSGRIRRD